MAAEAAAAAAEEEEEEEEACVVAVPRDAEAAREEEEAEAAREEEAAEAARLVVERWARLVVERWARLVVERGARPPTAPCPRRRCRTQRSWTWRLCLWRRRCCPAPRALRRCA